MANGEFGVFHLVVTGTVETGFVSMRHGSKKEAGRKKQEGGRSREEEEGRRKKQGGGRKGEERRHFEPTT